jgi:muramoyltetrapeptide carboxypeptidase
MLIVLAGLGGRLDPMDGQQIIFPAALEAGDTIRLVAPAGPLDAQRIKLAEKRLREKGFQVQIPDDLFRADDYLAGTDARRAEELMQAFGDPNVAAIFPGTGGYGTMRILRRLNFDQIRQHPKILIGFSDITALHLAIHQKTGLVTFHSPNPMYGLGNEDGLSSFSEHWFWRALLPAGHGKSGDDLQKGYVLSPLAWASRDTEGRFEQACKLPLPTPLVSGKARGRIIGGNLSLIAALQGTPFEIVTEDRLLFLEDVGEAPYRVDRMLQSLQLAGKLDRLAGVVLGTFTRRENEDTSKETRTIIEVLTEYFSGRRYPVLLGFPVGHHSCNATLPIGVLCELDADQGSLRMLEDPTSTTSR